MARFRVLFLLVLFTSISQAGDLVITSGGDRVFGFNFPACSQAVYSPMVLQDPEPAIPGREMVMYTAGSVLFDVCTGIDYMSPERIGDKIWYGWRDHEGTWRDRDGDPATLDEPVISRGNFPWMQDSDYLAQNPGAYVGHVSSPSVVKVGNRYFMIFVATVNDPNLCGGGHEVSGTLCGECVERWSFFVPMWAVSDDGENWKVFESRPEVFFKNRAINAALFWSLPAQIDSDARSGFQGVTRTSMVVHEEEGRTYFYIAFNYAGPTRSKHAMVRLRYDENSPWGWSDDPQIWNSRAKVWWPCSRGALPYFINNQSDNGNIFAGYVASITRTDLFEDYKYIAMITASSGVSSVPGQFGFSNAIDYQLSNDLVTWTGPKRVSSVIPYFADGKSYDVSVVDPFYVEERRAFTIFFATADGDGDDGAVPNGWHDCDLSDHTDLPVAPFIGLGIYQGSGILSPDNGRDGGEPKPPR